MVIAKKKRRASLEGLVVSFKVRRTSDVCVRRWKTCSVTCWFELSLLCGFLGSALLCAALLGATLFRCFLSTFFSCHSFYVLLLSRLVLVCFFMTTRYCV